MFCSYGSLRSWFLVVLEIDVLARPAERPFLSGKYKYKTIDRKKKIKPYKRLPSKPPGPKFQYCTKLHTYPLCEGLFFLSTGPKRAAQRQH